MNEETKMKLASAGIDITEIIPADSLVVPKALWNDWAAKIEQGNKRQQEKASKESGEYHTPPPAIDAIMANPPFGDLPPGIDGVEPRDTPISPDAPKMERGEDRYMSRPEAIYILGKLATSRRINVDGVIALQMGARELFKRHFDRQRNWARRRERAAEDSKRTTASAEHEQEAQS